MYHFFPDYKLFLLFLFSILRVYFKELSDNLLSLFASCSEIVREYDQKIPQSQTADNPVDTFQTIGFKQVNFLTHLE